MGTGKTSVGHVLASLLHFQMLDTDELIERRGQRTISEIFRLEGEARFRQLEGQVVDELSRCSGAVIATGGGLAAYGDNLAKLRTHALVVCLWAGADTIWERVRHQTHRPLLHDPEPRAKIERLLAERTPFYRQADVLINTELRSVREVAQHVAHQFRLIRNGFPSETHDPATGG